MHNSPEKNLRFRIKFAESNIQWLLGDNPVNRDLVDKNLQVIQTALKDLKALEALEAVKEEVIEWTVSDISQPIEMRSNDLEFESPEGEWRHFTVIATPTRIVFGGACNVGFLESGYLMREDHETLDESLQALLADLETYYNDGPDYVSRIIYNECM